LAELSGSKQALNYLRGKKNQVVIEEHDACIPVSAMIFDMISLQPQFVTLDSYKFDHP